jgi:RNA polymerase sigma factor (TIGR02999 family)
LRKIAGKTVMESQSRFADDDDLFDPRADPSGSAENRRALDTLFSTTYEELRRLAASVRRNDPKSSLSPTTLVNEAWLKLAKSLPGRILSEIHFKRIAARAMRQILVEAARRRNAQRRGGNLMLVTFDEGESATTSGADEVLALDEALKELARINPRHATMIESRFFGGLDIPETAQLLQVSEATVLRDWRAARAWLLREMRAS